MLDIIEKKQNRKGQFESQGKNIAWGTKPISVKYPPNIEKLLRSLEDRSEYIRQAVIEKLTTDGLI